MAGVSTYPPAIYQIEPWQVTGNQWSIIRIQNPSGTITATNVDIYLRPSGQSDLAILTEPLPAAASIPQHQE